MFFITNGPSYHSQNPVGLITRSNTLLSGPPGIPVREFPGIWHCQIPGGNSREFCDNCDRLFFFLLFHYLSSFITIYNTLSVNYNVLSINHWSIISRPIGTKLQFRNPLGTIFWVWADRPGSYRLHADRGTEVTSFCVRKSCMDDSKRVLIFF